MPLQATQHTLQILGDLMGENEITYDDILEYESLFSLAPSFLLESFAKRESNLVLKFKSTIQSYMNNLDNEQKGKLDIILDSDISQLQSLMQEAYQKTNKKQFRILANPRYKHFIDVNLDEIRKML